MSPNRKDEPKKTLRGERVYRVLSLLGVATMCFLLGIRGETASPPGHPLLPGLQKERTHVVQSALTRQCHNQPVSCWKGPRVPSVVVEKAADPSTVLPRYGAGYQHRRPNRATKPGTTRNIDGHRMLIPEIAWFSVYGCFTKGLLYIVRFLLTLLSPTVDGII